MPLLVHVEDGDTHSPEDSCPLVPLAMVVGKAVDLIVHLVLAELGENEHACNVAAWWQPADPAEVEDFTYMV